MRTENDGRAVSTGADNPTGTLTYRESERYILPFLYLSARTDDIALHKISQAFRTKIEQLLPFLLLLFLGQTVFRLSQLEFAVALESDEADTEIGSAKIHSKEISFLFARRPTEYECRNHRLDEIDYHPIR